MRDEARPAPRRTPGAGGEGSWRLDRMAWPEVEKVLARNPRLLVPVGSLASHGPHLPLGSNTLIAERLARALARETGVLLAPTLSYSVRSPGKERFAGTTGLERKTLHRLPNELLAGREAHGVQHFFLLTAYRHEPHLDALLMAAASRSRRTVMDLLAMDAGDLLEASPLGELGGEMETSLLLFLAPELVRTQELSDAPAGAGSHRKYLRGGIPTPPHGSRGTVGFPSRASAEKGQALYHRYLSLLQEILAGGPTREGKG